MTRVIQSAVILFVLTATIAVGTIGVEVYWVGKRINATLDNINAPCVGYHGSFTCGTLAQIDQTTKNIGIVSARSAQQVEQTGKLITAAAEAVKDTSKNANTNIERLTARADDLAQSGTRTLDAATESLGEARKDLGTLNSTIAVVQPLLAQLTANGASLQDTTDALNDTLKRKAVGEMLDNLAEATGQGNAILGDFRQVSDKARADYLRPVPWYMQPIHRAGDFLDIGAAIARHTP